MRLSPCLKPLYFGVSGVITVFIDGFVTIFGLRVDQRIAGSAIMSLTVTLLRDLFSGDRRSRLVGLNASILAIGAAGYSFLRGVLALLSWAVPFVCIALGIVIAVASSARLLSPDSTTDASGLSYVINTARAVPTRRALGLYTSMFDIFVILYGAQLTIVPFILDNLLGSRQERLDCCSAS